MSGLYIDKIIVGEFGLSFYYIVRSMHGEGIRSEFGLSFTILHGAPENITL